MHMCAHCCRLPLVLVKVSNTPGYLNQPLPISLVTSAQQLQHLKQERRIHLCPVCHAGFVEEDEWSAHVLAHTPGGVDFSLEEQLAVTLLALPPKLSLVLFAESDLEALRYLTLLSVELRAISPEAKEQVLRGVARCLDPELHSGEELLERLRNQPRGLAARMGLLVQSLPAHRRTPG